MKSVMETASSGIIIMGCVVALWSGLVSEIKVEWKNCSVREIEEGTGQVKLDGTLSLSFPLANNADLGISYNLAHGLESTFAGQPSSFWEVSGIKTMIIPDGRNGLNWLSLSGKSVKFRKDSLSQTFRFVGEGGCFVRLDEANRIVIRDSKKREWRYCNGMIESVVTPIHGKYNFICQGGYICSIIYVGNGSKKNIIFNATYESKGRLATISSENGRFIELEWSDQGLLGKCNFVRKGAVSFEYEDRLLVGVVVPRQVKKRILWQRNVNYRPELNRWMAAAYVKENERYQYDYAIDSRGFIIKCHDSKKSVKYETLYNPVTGVVRQQGTSFSGERVFIFEDSWDF